MFEQMNISNLNYCYYIDLEIQWLVPTEPYLLFVSSVIYVSAYSVEENLPHSNHQFACNL